MRALNITPKATKRSKNFHIYKMADLAGKAWQDLVEMDNGHYRFAEEKEAYWLLAVCFTHQEYEGEVSA